MNERNQIVAQTSVGAGEELDIDVLRQPTIHYLEPVSNPVETALARATQALLSRQAEDGHWRFDLEADTTIPAEYLFLHYFMGTVDAEREARIANYLRARQQDNGSWALYCGGAGDMSATVKTYFALKLAGDDPQAPHMTRARQWVLENGGAESVNVFTRITLAIFGQLPWRTVPAMPLEIMFLPKWWFFNLSKVSYWSRCVIVPLLIIFAHRPVRKIPAERGIGELFCTDPEHLKHLDHFKRGKPIANAFLLIDRILKTIDPIMPRFMRAQAVRRAEKWMRAHAQGKGGIGAIFPAIANTAMALKLLGAKPHDSDLRRTLAAIEDLVLENEEETYCQPCVGPVWDTCLCLNALTESGATMTHPEVRRAVEWLFDQQIFVPGDWCDQAPGLVPGGWAFQYENDKYPDVDDTGMVLMALLRAGGHEQEHKVKRINQAVNWILGMQNKDGSWGAFDIGNNYEYLNNIPFADHGALVDPGTADLTARCIEMLAMLGYDRSFPPIRRALEFLRRDQRDNGAWYGRWGVNYIYGTWSVLAALGVLGEDLAEPYVLRAIAWLKRVQNEDGGWGESCNTYDEPRLAGVGASTASQTAWALLGLMAVGEGDSRAVKRGVDYLLRTQNEAGEWDEAAYTGTGFPRVFYLRYHGYSRYFPLWALSSYARLQRGIATRQEQLIAAGSIDLGALAALGPA